MSSAFSHLLPATNSGGWDCRDSELSDQTHTHHEPPTPDNNVQAGAGDSKLFTHRSRLAPSKAVFISITKRYFTVELQPTGHTGFVHLLDGDDLNIRGNAIRTAESSDISCVSAKPPIDAIRRDCGVRREAREGELAQRRAAASKAHRRSGDLPSRRRSWM